MSVMIQIRNVPDDLHRKLKARAAEAGRSLSDYLLEEVRRVAERPTLNEMLARLEALPTLELGESAEDAVRAERDSR
jgi:plasmid stability protein